MDIIREVPSGTTEHARLVMHSFVSCLMHCVWTTKDRRPLLTPDLQRRLWPYLVGIARESGMKALAVGGTEDHVHALVSIPSTLTVAKSIQLLKGNSSKWTHETFKENCGFEWQKGYGAFSIGISGVEDTTRYILAQASHHQKTTFKEEIEVFLKKHGMEYVEQDLD
ncbi:MAG: IS200/IS605 family transposase [Candidatus Hydrogenedentes bacterium]|nr:IS200/IS605 family transposase [Candidatus Hydrogenedentota bacterium]